MVTCEGGTKKGSLFYNGAHLEEEEEEEEKKKEGKPHNSWVQEVTTGMREKEINIMEWIDREEWRREIKLCVQKYVKTLIFYK